MSTQVPSRVDTESGCVNDFIGRSEYTAASSSPTSNFSFRTRHTLPCEP